MTPFIYFIAGIMCNQRIEITVLANSENQEFDIQAYYGSRNKN
jgi:hypothetical protein